MKLEEFSFVEKYAFMKNYIPTKKLTILSFVLFVINSLALMILGKSLAKFSGSQKLDFQISGYDQSFITRLFTDYGPEGRGTYFWLTVVDTPFPFLLAFFGVCYFGYTWKKWNYNMIWLVLVVASLSFCLFDTIENIFVYRMLANFPMLTSTEILISSLSTQIKLISLLIVYVAIQITFVAGIVRRSN